MQIEILSPSNEVETRANIWADTTVPRVREILAVRSTRIEAELLIRGADGTWPAEPEIIGPGGILTLPSIAFTAPLASFCRTTVLAAPGSRLPCPASACDPCGPIKHRRNQ